MAKATRRVSTPRTDTSSSAIAAVIEHAGAPAEIDDLPKLRLTPPDAYGAILSDETMVPVLMPGTVAIVHPHLAPRVGHGCVLRSESGELALIREYLGQTAEHWHLRQRNPLQDITVDKRCLPACHMIVGNYLID
jgi:hypothetical protein